VLDDWFVKTVRPRLKGKAFIMRYADDAVIGCERAEDADRIMKVLALRFAKYGLMIHPEKTRLIDFTEPEDGVGKGAVGRGTKDRQETVEQVDTSDNRPVPEEPG
jgi:hypothetical protein